MAVPLPSDKEKLKEAISGILRLGEGEVFSYTDSAGRRVNVTPRRGRKESAEQLMKAARPPKK